MAVPNYTMAALALLEDIAFVQFRCEQVFRVRTDFLAHDDDG